MTVQYNVVNSFCVSLFPRIIAKFVLLITQTAFLNDSIETQHFYECYLPIRTRCD